eukprot:tig00000342_g24242.t1
MSAAFSVVFAPAASAELAAPRSSAAARSAVSERLSARRLGASRTLRPRFFGQASAVAKLPRASAGSAKQIVFVTCSGEESGRRRVVITGMGVVSCYGTDIDDLYDGLLKGRKEVVPLQGVQLDGLATTVGGQIAPELLEEARAKCIDPTLDRELDPEIRYALIASKLAVQSAKITEEDLAAMKKSRCGVIVGSALAGLSAMERAVAAVAGGGSYKDLAPMTLPFAGANMPSALLAKELGFTGPSYAVSAGCASGASSIIAGDDLRGTEAPLTRVGIAGLNALGTLSTSNDDPARAGRPWSASRDGIALGEGAGILILEELEHALDRGAPIWAEYFGGARTCDARSVHGPVADGSSIARAMEGAIADAGMEPTEIEHLNAGACGSRDADAAEAAAIKAVFPAEHRAERMWVNSTKGSIGHALGASGALQAVVSVRAIMAGLMFPLAGLEDPDAALEGIRWPGPKLKVEKIETSLLNAYGLGGHIASIVISAYRNHGPQARGFLKMERLRFGKNAADAAAS